MRQISIFFCLFLFSSFVGAFDEVDIEIKLDLEQETDSRVDVRSEINLQERGEGFVFLFKELQQEKRPRKIYVIVNGASIVRVLEMRLTKGGALMIIHHRVGKRIKKKIVKVEEIDEVGAW